jgi:anti-sigma-K factor RskA
VSKEPHWLADDLAAYALGALDDARAVERVEAELERDPLAREQLADYRRAVEILPFGVELQVPPAELRARVLAQIGLPAAGTAPRTPRWMGAALAASLLGCAGLGVWTWSMTQRGAKDSESALAPWFDVSAGTVVALAGTGDPDASARLFVPRSGEAAKLAVRGLAPLDASRIYQLWFKQGDQPVVSGGTFRVDERGEALLAVNVPGPIGEMRAIAVTEEAAPGVPKPTGKHLVDLMP